MGSYKTAEGEALRDWFLNEGLNIRPLGPTVYLMPPYCISDEQLARGPMTGFWRGWTGCSAGPRERANPNE
ncbi:MAG: hypothetical protein MI824_15915 [Hyphomicrobiales bacterium]|nr:hypothetical protein [Hyphomicrobiales bacterium]